MAIYMQVDGISGSVTTQGFQNWIELSSFQWGMSRPIGAVRGSTGREASNPTIGEIHVTKRASASTMSWCWGKGTSAICWRIT